MKLKVFKYSKIASFDHFVRRSCSKKENHLNQQQSYYISIKKKYRYSCAYDQLKFRKLIHKMVKKLITEINIPESGANVFCLNFSFQYCAGVNEKGRLLNGTINNVYIPFNLDFIARKKTERKDIFLNELLFDAWMCIKKKCIFSNEDNCRHIHVCATLKTTSCSHSLNSYRKKINFTSFFTFVSMFLLGE